ncbi:MAG TPA: hypothetical protein PLD25_18055 [Chloroflexota bacterium]|nr:hypothetical protein [Chloroflexota bacterium]HUM72491.1 hypothetical protein [Chloroflexota bacterium]
METKNRPDMIILAMTWLSLFCLGGLFGGLLTFVVIIPAIFDMGLSSRSSVGVMNLLGVLALLVAVVAAWAMLGLWQGKAHGRALTLMLTTITVLVSALSIPVLLLLGLQGIALFVPLLTAVFLLVAGSGVLWGLTRPSASFSLGSS